MVDLEMYLFDDDENELIPVNKTGTCTLIIDNFIVGWASNRLDVGQDGLFLVDFVT